MSAETTAIAQDMAATPKLELVEAERAEQLRVDEQNVIKAAKATAQEVVELRESGVTGLGYLRLLNHVGNIVLANIVHGSYHRNYRPGYVEDDVTPIETEELIRQHKIQQLKLDLQAVYYNVDVVGTRPTRPIRRLRAKQLLGEIFLGQYADILRSVEEREDTDG